MRVAARPTDHRLVTSRRAGQHARDTTRQLAVRVLLAVVALVAVGLAVGTVLGFRSTGFALAEVVAIAAMLFLDRVAFPVVDRWDRGADGEEHVGRILDGLHDSGWLTLHDVDTGRGNIDPVLVGPGGVLTVETKSHPGRLAVAHLDERMLKQAYAQAKHVERITGHKATALLVFSRAYLDRPVGQRRGVTVLPARMLGRHLARRRELAPPEVADLHRRLSAALA
jgi:hypothetical protein